MATDSAELSDVAPHDSSMPPTPVRLSAWRRLATLIVNHNPFYLISVSCVLHGTARWFRSDGSPMESPWPLIGLVGGYILLLAIVAWIIVRFGKQWNDARSLLVTIPLLFVELSLLFDETLLRDYSTGQALLMTGLLGAIVVSEGLLRGLGIRLSWGYRLPYHLLLALLFLYPISLASLSVISNPDLYSWRIFLFSTIAAAIALMLWPAVRRGADLVRDNGTPWAWPLYPWSLFCMLFVSVGFRAYALTLSFDPVLSLDPAASDRLESAFGLYYLVPLVLACGVLWLEGAIASRSRFTQNATMLIPALALWLSIPAMNGPAPYNEFLWRFMDQLASPFWMTLLAAALFYAWAWCRGIALAELGLLASLSLLTVVESQTIGLHSLQQPVAWPVFVIAVIEVLVAHQTRRSGRALFGTMAFVVSVLSISLHAEPLIVRISVGEMLILASVLWIGLHFQDWLAAICRRVGAGISVLATIAGSIGYELSSNSSAEFSMHAIAFTVAMIALAWWYASIVRMSDYVIAGLCNLLVCGTMTIWHLLNWLRSVSAWQGITSFLLGLIWLLVGVLISSWKAGWLQSATTRWNRLITFDRS